VPIDEQWWVPQKTRDQLVRIEAADRLRAMFALVEVPPHRRVGDLLGAVSNPDPALVAGARALLGGEVGHAEPRLVSP
jgi:HEAT repeat protein